MSGEAHAGEHQQDETLSTLLWLGGSSPLSEAAQARFDIYHVRSPQSLLQALQYPFAACLVIDLALPGLDAASLLTTVRADAPSIGILALADDPHVVPSKEIDLCLGRDATLDDLKAAVQQVGILVLDRQPKHPTVADYHKLKDRMRHLEGLVQFTFNISDAVNEGRILGDLREAAQIAVDADEMAVLLADGDYEDLADLFDLGVPPDYLEACRTHLRVLPPEERPYFLGEEVLLHERLPGMLRSAPRVQEAEAAGAWSYMRLPLTVDERLVGFVAFFSRHPGQFDGAHLQLGRLFAAQVSTAVRNMRLYIRLNQIEQRQQAVGEVARLIAENLALDTVLSRIVEQAVRLVEGIAGSVLLIQPDDHLEVSAAYGDLGGLVGHRLPLGRGQAGIVAQTGQPSIVTDYPNWEHGLEVMRTRFPQDSVLIGVPLSYHGQVMGVLQVVGTKATPGDLEDRQNILMMLAPQAATAIANAQLHETVRRDHQRLRAILNHTAAAVAVCDAEGRLQLLNLEAERVLKCLGIESEAIWGQPVGDLLHRAIPDQSFDLAHLPPLIEVNLGSEGEYIVRVAQVMQPDGSVDHYVAVAQDVSQLRRLARIKGDLIRVLSHDLRNPLSLARGSLDLLSDPDLPPNQYVQLKEMIVSSLDRMEQLIQDVVDLEMAEALDEEMTVPYHLPALVQRVLQNYEDRARDQQLTLHYDEQTVPPQALKGHALLIEEAIDNLVSNAIKYTPEGGQVRVTLNVEEEHAVVRVEDTGYGIPAESLPNLFKQFYRVPDKRIRLIPGTGLGLSLVKTIARTHGGYVTAKSTLNVGSVFSLYLPLEGLPAVQQPEEAVLRLDLSNQVKSSPDAGGRPVK